MLIPGLLSSITSEASTIAQVQTIVILLVITLIVALISRRLRLVYTLVLVVVGLLIGFLPFLSHVHLPRTWRPLLVLSGLRGALSIALVLGLPNTLAQRNFIEDIVYGVVLVTLLGQGLALRVLLPRWPKEEETPSEKLA